MGEIQHNEESIFDVAIQIESKQAQEDYLQQVCGNDVALIERVRALLEIHINEQSFLANPPAGLSDTIEANQVTEQPGDVIGPFKLLQKIGEGGFGVVYMAEQSRPVRRKVALKVIKPGMDTKEVIARFGAERQALALMDHPNIAKVLDAGTTESGRPYFVMELVRGIPITEYCDQECLSTRERLTIFAKVCQAIQHAHQKGVIHRDIKPSNVLVTEHDGSPVPKVIDFGVAKAINQQLTEHTVFTQFQQMIGTPMYMSPEQAALSGLDIDTRSDVYSLGVLLYELLTGTTPFDKKQFKQAAYEEIRRIIREDEPPKPSTKISTMGETSNKLAGFRKTDVKHLSQLMRGELDWIVMKALEKDRKRRYETANGFANDIQRYLNDEPVLACPPSTAYRIRKFVRRNRGVVTAASLLMAVLCLGLAGTGAGWEMARRGERKATDARDEAEEERNKAKEAEEDAKRSEDEAIKALKRATVARLAAKSEAIRPRQPVKSLRVAIQAVNESRKDGGTVLPIAHEALMNATQLVGGRPLEGPAYRGARGRIAISGDSRWLAIASKDGVRVWDLKDNPSNSKPLLLQGHTAASSAFAISGDSRWLAIASENDVRVLDLKDNPSNTKPLLLQGHTDKVESLKFGPDHRQLFTGSRDTTIRFWDLSSEDPTTTSIEGTRHTESVTSVTVSQDGHWVASVAGNETFLWDLHDQNPADNPLVLCNEPEGAGKLEFSPDSRWLVSRGGENFARLYDLTADDPADSEQFLSGHTKRLNRFAFGPDSKWLATVSWDHTIRLWNLTLENPADSSLVLKGHHDRINHVVFSPDSRWLLTGSYDTTTRLWDVTASDPNADPVVLSGHQRWIEAARFSTDGRWVMTGSYDGTVRFWDLSSEDPAYKSKVVASHDSAVIRIVSSADGRWLVTAGQAGSPRLWQFDQHLETAPASSPFAFSINGETGEPIAGQHGHALALCPNGRWLFTRGWERARIWDMQSENMEASWHEFPIFSNYGEVGAAFSSDSRWLAASSPDATVSLWDLREADQLPPPRHLEGHTAPVMSLAFSRNGQALITGSQDNTARVWSMSDNGRVESSVLLPGHEEEVRCVCIGDQGHLCATLSGTEARIWDLRSQRLNSPRVVSVPRQYPRMTLTPDNRWLVLWLHGSELMVVDLDSAALSPRLIEGHTGMVRAVEVTPDGRWLVTGGWDNTARIWDLHADDPWESATVLRGHSQSIADLAISEDGHWLITAGADATARVWDIRDISADPPSHPTYTLRGNHDFVLNVDINSAARRAVSAGWDEVRIWELDVDKLYAEAIRLAGRELTPEEQAEYLSDGL